MITEEKFLKIIKLVLNELNEITFNKNCEIITGKDVWYPTSINIFETSFVERIVMKLTDYEKKIGWEVSYPSDDVGGYHDWRRSKLDFAFDFIDKFLFRTVIEVKTWNGKDKYLHHLWSDIFKLYGQCCPNV